MVVAGIGSEYRRDDGAGPAVARQAADLPGVVDVGPAVDPLDLLGRWDDADLAVVVDAIRSGAPPGTVRVVDLDEAVPAPALSTHGLGLADVLRLARTVGRAPRRVVVIGIEGEDFGRGEGLSDEVAAAVPEAVRAVVSLVEEAR